MTTAQAKVLEIHRAVDLSVTNLLQDDPFDKKAIEALKALGFTSAENVEEAKDHEEHKKLARYYAHTYPGYKFITHYQLNKIADKYKLSTQGLDRFKGGIPQKNINDMVNFKIKFKEVQHHSYQKPRWMARFDDNDFESSVYRALGIPPELNGLRAEGSRFGVSVTDRHTSDGMDALYLSVNIGDFTSMSANSDRPTIKFNQEEAAKAAVKALQEMDNPNKLITFAEINKRFPAAVKITAEKELFKAPDPLLDPIVTVAVNGGYLVVTAWGAEASDPEIINPAMN